MGLAPRSFEREGERATRPARRYLSSSAHVPEEHFAETALQSATHVSLLEQLFLASSALEAYSDASFAAIAAFGQAQPHSEPS